jgi:hypothetical protein
MYSTVLLLGTEVTIITVYATRFIYYPLLEDILFISQCFSSFEPSSGNTIRFYENYCTYDGSVVLEYN